MRNPDSTQLPFSPARPRAFLFLWLTAALAVAVTCATSCTGGASSKSVSPQDLAGTWRVVLDSPGGDLPIIIEIFDSKATSEGESQPAAFMHNPPNRDPITQVDISGRRVTLRISYYDSALTGQLDASGKKLVGTWQKTAAHGRTSLPFQAFKDQTHRFSPDPPQPPGDAKAVPSVAGTWATTFEGEHGFPALGEFEQKGEVVIGSFLTSAGDTRYLTGRYKNGVLELSSFNGAFASLFRARAQADGTLRGQFWMNDDEFYTWTAKAVSRKQAAAFLPDPYKAVKVTSKDKRLHFRFPDLDGNMVSLDDKRFQGKAVLVALVGSWCQNCNDEAPLLADLYARYHDRGLEMVGLAYEFTGDRDRDRDQVEIFQKRHNIQYPLLLAGTVNETKPLESMTAIPTYPVTIFIGRDGKVRKIHTGFAGPSTGEHHKQLIAEFEADIEALVAEPAP